MSNFIYPGRDRLVPRLRRFAGGSLVAGVLIATFFVVEPHLDPKTFDALLALTPLSKDRFASLLANPWAGLLVVIGLSWLLSKWLAVEVLEFHFFPWFDDETLRPVGEQSGLLRWIDLEDSPAHEASGRLRAWLSAGVHDGDWLVSWVLRGRPALKEKAFSYALLLGPNGVGKSQMAREVAREKVEARLAASAGRPRRGAFARAGHALVRWLRRVLPGTARLPDDPWHGGEIIPLGDWSERMKAWRPSAPTVLILDDPYSAQVRDVIDILDKNSGQFWYTVKLIIIDQFVPWTLELEPIGSARRDHLGREIPILTLPDLRWSGAQARRALSQGVWIRDAATGDMRFDPAHDISEFWKAENIERLSRALDGNPLMLAEAAVWLAARNGRGRPYRTIDALLSLPDPESFEQQIFDGQVTDDYRSKIAHRILKERVDEVFASHLAWARDMVLDQAEVIEALCCASLAGGAPLAAFEVFSKAQGARLEKWIVQDVGEAASLPPVGSWPIVEAFIERALADFRTLTFDALVRRALAVNPVGLARRFTCKGRLARRLFDHVAALESDEATGSPYMLNLFGIAAARAIRADRQALPRALAALERLPAEVLPRAQAEIEKLGACNGVVPDVLAAALLLTALGARRFAEAADWDWSAWESFHPLWTRWLRRFGHNLDFVPLALRDPMKIAGDKLYAAFFVALEQRDDPERVFEILVDALAWAPNATLLDGIPLEDVSPIPSWPAVFRNLFVLKGICWDELAIAAGAEDVRRRAAAAAAAAKDLVPADADPRQRAYIDAYILSRRIKLETEAGSSLGDIEAIRNETVTLTRDFSHDPNFAQRLLFLTTFIARKLKETRADGSVAWALAEEAEAFAKSFLSDELCVENLIWCWGYTLGLADVEDDEAFNGVIDRLRICARAFPNSATIPSALARLLDLRMEALAEIENGQTTEARLLALISQIETVAREAPDFADVQWCRACGWQHLAQSWRSDDKNGLKLGAIARHVDAFAQAFPDHILQTVRLSIWRDYAFHESRYGVAPDEAERIAHRITWAAHPFRRLVVMSNVVAIAWEAAVYGWHRDPREWASCERALRRLDAWISENSVDSSGVHAQIMAWGSLLDLHRKRRDFESLARLEPEALARVETARSAYPDDAEMAEAANYVFAEVALSRRDRNAGRPAIEEMAELTRAMVDRFPLSKNVRTNNDLVEGLLRGLAANAPPSTPAQRDDARYGGTSGSL